MVKSGRGAGTPTHHQVFQPRALQGRPAQIARLDRPLFARTAIFATRASANCWAAHTLPTLQFLLERIIFFTLSLMQCQRRLQIFQFKNSGSVFELSGVAFHGIATYSLLVDGFIFVRFD